MILYNFIKEGMQREFVISILASDGKQINMEVKQKH